METKFFQTRVHCWENEYGAFVNLVPPVIVVPWPVVCQFNWFGPFKLQCFFTIPIGILGKVSNQADRMHINRNRQQPLQLEWSKPLLLSWSEPFQLEWFRRTLSNPFLRNPTEWHLKWSGIIGLSGSTSNHVNWNGSKPFQIEWSITIVISLVPTIPSEWVLLHWDGASRKPFRLKHFETIPIGTHRPGTTQGLNYAIHRN